MHGDISSILKTWAYDPGKVSARRIVAEDGREVLQLRLDLGLLQMETAGRPDGQRPHGFESLLDYYEHMLVERRIKGLADEDFRLDEPSCELLRAEGVMYYHRYLTEFILDEYEAVERDTRRNLRLMDFPGKYAQREEDRASLEQFRPYVIMMHTRAKAMMDVQASQFKEALTEIRTAIDEISSVYRTYEQEEALEGSQEIEVLRSMAKEIREQMPVDPVERLRRRLAKAIREERYEEAAHLRDQIRRESEKAK